MDKAYWAVVLNNGEVIYEKTHGYRHGYKWAATWGELREYCMAMDLWIVEMELRFRSNSVQLPSNQAGYYFVNQVFQTSGDKEASTAFIAGCLDNGVLTVGRWKTPELVLLSTEVRTIRDNDECFIMSGP